MTPGEILGTWIAAGLTLMMFSFIYKDNVFYRIGEHLYLGVSVGYMIGIQYWQAIWPVVIRSITLEHNYWTILPMIIGIFIVLRLVPSLSWLSRMSFAFIIGAGAGFGIPFVIHSVFLKQLYETLRPFDAPWGQNVNQIIILLSVFTVIIFFFFSLEHKRTVGAISRVGLFFIMIGFGAAFGYTVMARISLLIGRFQFLIFDWIQGTILGGLFHGGGGAPG
jgi:hypothetical protein